MDFLNLDLPMFSFATQHEWEQWLEQNHASAKGIWLRFYKKASGVKTVAYDEAVEVALCYGWIDGQLKTLDKNSYLQRFTPRRARSIWSKINVDRVECMIKEGRMKPSGLKEVEAAKANGNWDRAYGSFSNIEMPVDFLAELSKDADALAFFESLNKTNKYAIAWRLETAKRPETRQKRFREMIEMMKRNKKFY